MRRIIEIIFLLLTVLVVRVGNIPAYGRILNYWAFVNLGGAMALSVSIWWEQSQIHTKALKLEDGYLHSVRVSRYRTYICWVLGIVFICILFQLCLWKN